MEFESMVLTATGHSPYRWQAKVAESGLPDLIAVETGAGKTEGVVLPWLWRRREHPEAEIRSATPHWLVLCLPLRVLVEQVERSIGDWLAALGLTDDVAVHLAMGGRPEKGVGWRDRPEQDAVVIGTVDTLISRALNRGYGTSRYSWPIDYGLLHNGTHWVFDEIQLLGPALATARQLQGLRQRLGTALPTGTTCMSATVDLPTLSTVDNPELTTTVELGDDDRADPALAVRLNATKRVEQLAIDPKDRKRMAVLAAELRSRHRAGTLTVAVMNTVSAAKDLHAELMRTPGTPAGLLHSRFRPPDRRDRVAETLAPVDPAGPGRVVVATQVIEAGVDLSAATLFTEAAPWPSVVQRAGRCNRDGKSDGALLLWASVKDPLPYAEADIAAAGAALIGLEGQQMTAATLRSVQVEVSRPVHPVLRRTDLLGLFDTSADLSGNDIDVAPFIRPDEQALDVQIAWRDLSGAAPGEEEPGLRADELCPAPVNKALREWVRGHQVWRLDPLAGGPGARRRSASPQRWVLARAEELRPGQLLLVDAAVGGYTAAGGFDPAGRVPVPPVAAAEPVEVADDADALGDDSLSITPGSWVTLHDHLADVEVEVTRLLDGLGATGLAPQQAAAAVVAGRLHDLGKAHPAWQKAIVAVAGDDPPPEVTTGGPWAKSGSRGRLRYPGHPYLRHELVSALALLAEGSVLLRGVAEPDLVVYLVAAHHGRVRVGIRSVPEEEQTGRLLGVEEGDVVPETVVPRGLLPMSTLSLESARLGRGAEGEPSWAERALTLLHRDDLGPFRLGFLEAVVRLGDWRASGRPGAGKDGAS